jgi:hypothetical protein
MATIDVDFDVYKALTLRRSTEDMTYNDVLRDLLQLGSDKSAKPAAVNSAALVYKGVEFPEGTQFRATYKGQTFTGAVKGGVWVDEKGAPQKSPSEAAYNITRTHVNGWRFWEVRRPSDTRWRSIDDLRKK